MKSPAEFRITEITNDYMYIVDIGCSTRCRSVADDVDYVIGILQWWYGLGKKRIFYMDTERRICEIEHKNGIFTGFRAGHGDYTLPAVVLKPGWE